MDYIRGDYLEGATKNGRAMFWERWDIREVDKGFLEIHQDEYYLITEHDKLALMIPNPAFVNPN